MLKIASAALIAVGSFASTTRAIENNRVSKNGYLICETEDEILEIIAASMKRDATAMEAIKGCKKARPNLRYFVISSNKFVKNRYEIARIVIVDESQGISETGFVIKLDGEDDYLDFSDGG